MLRRKHLSHPLVLGAAALGLLGLTGLMPETGRQAGSFALLRLGLAMAGIMALVLGAVPALRRLPLGPRGGQGRLRCVEQLVLDGRHRLALISVDGRELLVGLQADGFVLLRDLGADAAADRASGEEALPSLPAASPAEAFAAILARRRGA
jgi:flagellar biogenesis protein FliO